MKKNTLIGISIIAVILLVLASLTNVVGVQTVELSNDKEIKEKDNPVGLLLQLIHLVLQNREIMKLVVNSELGANVEGEITRIIEEDKELNSIINEIKSLDCDCDDSIEWQFPVICTLLIPLFIITFYLYFMMDMLLPFAIIISIGTVLNCFWTQL